MYMGQIVGQLKIIVLVVGLIALLGAGASPEALREPMSHPLNVSTNSEGEELATFLEDFKFIPGSAVLIEGNYVLALYESSQRQLLALALFTVDRDPEYSTLTEEATFLLVDAQGEDVKMQSVSNGSGECFTVVKNIPLSAEPVRVDGPRSIVSHRCTDQIETDFTV